MTFGSLFSGGGGADIGLESAGMKCLWQCECDRQCNDVRRYRFPGIPNVLDVRNVSEFDSLPAPHAIWLSPPCQDLSVAGKRAGLSGERSGLFYDAVRVVSGFVERGTRFALMEQVPGLLSSHAGADFREVLRSFLDIGARDIAWAVLDSQWFGVPQRRRRVYFVVDFGGECAGEILALSYGLQRHSPPSREAREGTTHSVAGSIGGGSGNREFCDDLGRSGAFIPTAPVWTRPYNDHASQESGLIVAGPLTKRTGKGPNTTLDDGALVAGTLAASGAGMDRPAGQCNETSFLVTHSLRADGSDASEDGTGRGTPIIPFDTTQITSEANRSQPQPGDPCHPLASQAHPPAIAIQHAQIGRKDEARPCADAVAFQWQNSHTSQGVCESVESAPSIQTEKVPAVAFQEAQTGVREYDDAGKLRSNGPGHDPVGTRIRQGMSVRRLTPRECERLQSWPDDFSRYGMKESGQVYELADGPRYKMLGNGVTSTVSKWIGQQLLAVAAEEAA